MGVKIITPPTITAVISDADLRTHLRIGTGEEELMSAYRLAAHKMAEHYTGYAIGSQVRELALDEFPSEFPYAIELPGGPVTAIGSIKYFDTAEVLQTLATDQYTLEDYGTPCWAVLAVDATWPTTLDAANAVKVQFTVGDVPDAAKAAMLLITAHLFANRGDGAQDMPQAARALLDTVRVYS